MIPKIFRRRLRKLRLLLKKNKIPALLVSKQIHIRYLTGFRGDDSWILVTPDSVVAISDFRYEEELERDHPWLERVIRQKGESVFQSIARTAARKALRHLGFESQYVSVAFHQALNKVLGRRLRLVPTKGLIEGLRLVKSSREIGMIRSAARITDKVLTKLLRSLKAGKREIDLKLLAEQEMKRLGSEGPAFDIILVSGPKSSRPHAETGKNKLKSGTMLLIDMGSRLGGYHSDLTRTFFMGSISARFRDLFKAVLRAQEAALASIRPGVLLSRVDQAAREALKKEGLAEYFGHSTGHGVGLEIHEAPYVSPSSREKARENMVFTVEPGIYIPGWGGIRIEDTVRVTKTGCEVLTRFSKNKIKVSLKR